MMSGFLGATPLRISPLGLGLAALGRPGYINLGHASDLQHDYAPEAMQNHTFSVLDKAFESGIRYFDAARSYGLAERFLGQWLSARAISPAEVTIGSKWGYTYTAGWQVQADQHEVKEHSLAVLNRQWQESRGNLGPYIKLYQIHSATLDSGVLDNTAVLDRLAVLKAGGVAVGLTVSGPNQADVIELALDVRVDGLALFDSVQVTWNLLERSCSSVLKRAADAGIGIIVKEALANGRLTSRNTKPGFDNAMQVLKGQAERLHTTIDAVALAAVLAQPWVSVVLSGAARIDHLQSNVKALDVVWDQETDTALAAIVETPETYWTIRSNLKWN